MAKRLRIFISSPGDVRDAREVAARTVETISPDYLRHFEVEPYMWETEALLASGHFQDAIEPPSQFDIVVLILWSRLGTPLPEQTAVRRYAGIDGRTPITGTEWEYEDALSAARANGVPDLLVYRNRNAVQVDGWDAEQRQNELNQLAALDVFWRRHFADQGTFIGAYHEYRDLEDFAQALESHLRRLIDLRVAAAAAQAKPAPRVRLWTQSPFRGLEAYDYRHVPIFFGRERSVGKALSQLIDNAKGDAAFLLVLGASGSGKSSLMMAGLAPRLGLPRRVVGSAFLRRAAYRPSDRSDTGDLFDALARVLTAKGESGVGLPELGEAQRVAALCRDAPEQAHALIAHVLDQLSETARREGRILLHEQAVLLLLLDQLEEMFTDHRISFDERRKFMKLIASLARSRRVWVIATMRADLWRRAAETPELVDLARGLGRFDLLPPGPAEISQMIRLPAEAAGLEYETSAIDGVPLNDRIAEDATSAPGVLPLLSYLLEQLYLSDALERQSRTLSYASYQALGGLRGAIAACAERVFSELPEEVRATLRPLLFSLVQIDKDPSGAATTIARRAPLAAFAEGSAARGLISALLDAKPRLLVADQAGEAGPTIRVAHEALLTEWTRARDLIAEDAVLLDIRRDVEQRFARWQTLRPSRNTGLARLFRTEAALLTAVELADALRLQRQFAAELPRELIEYIDRSSRLDSRARRRTILGLSALALVMAALAAIAAVMAVLANLNAAEAKVQLMDREVVDDQRDGDDLLKIDPNQAIGKYAASVDLANQVAKAQPGNPQWLLNLASAHEFLGYAFHKRGGPGDQQRAQAEYQLALDAARACANADGAAPDVRKGRIALQSDVEGRLAH